MIIIFHSLYFIAKFLLKYYRRRAVLRDFLQNIKRYESESANENENNEIHLESLKFDPPVYLQRYCDVQELLLDVRWGNEMAKIVEFGCAELKLFTYLKRLLYVKEILHVDIDEELLKDSLFRIEPLTVDHLVQRSHPLSVQVLAGSVSDPDYRLRGADAVIAIELIEHLYPDTLEALPYNIFEYIRARIVIFTTPNADFNVLFPNFSGMRHYDHKFEWTRAQFRDWCENIIKRFPQYSVTIQGCGSGPPGTEHLGCCSQMAVFVKDYDRVESEVPRECRCDIYKASDIADICDAHMSYGICTYYSYSKVLEELSASSLSIVVEDKVCPEMEMEIVASQSFYRLVHKIDYPYYPDTRTPNEIKLDEAKYKIHQARIYRQRYYVEDLGRLQIPVYDLICNNHGQISTVTEMSKLLSDAGFNLERCACDGSGQVATCVIQYPDMESSGRTSPSEPSDPPAADEDDPSTGHRPRDKQQLDYWTDVLQKGNEDEDSWDNNAPLSPVLRNDERDTIAPTINRLHLGAISAEITNVAVDSDPIQHNSDLLIDSGYQKSITSATEWSPQSPLQDGMFEDQFNSCGGGGTMDAIDGPPPEDRSPPPPPQKRTFTYATSAATVNVVVGSETGGARCGTPPPGTSAANGKKTKRDVKDSAGTRKKTRSKVYDLLEEDVRDLTQCLILNSLNMLPSEEAPPPPPPSPLAYVPAPDLCGAAASPVLAQSQIDAPIDILQPPEEVHAISDGGGAAAAVIDAVLVEAVHVPQHGVLLLDGADVVENGDLANNNRDLEGNNYPDIEMDVRQQRRDIRDDLEDNLNENFENHIAAIAAAPPIIPHHDADLQLANHNQDVANRNNVPNMPEPAQVFHPAALPDVNEQPPAQQLRLPSPIPDDDDDDVEQQMAREPLQQSRSRLLVQVGRESAQCGVAQSSEAPELAEVHRASREALFDSDSQIDLLEDVPVGGEVARVFENVDEGVDDRGHQRARNIVLVGVNNYDEGMEDPFPHWLLQLLGDEGDPHEPHFYCQGDGVGVHPSIVEVDIEDDEQSTSSSSADTSSSAEDNAIADATTAATTAVSLHLDETEQPISLASGSVTSSNDTAFFSPLNGGGNDGLGLEVIGLSIHPRLHVDHLTPPNPPPSSVATTPLDPISPRTSLNNIATATTNLLDIFGGGSTAADRDSADELFFDTTDDLPLAIEEGVAAIPRCEGRLEEDLAASEIVVGSSFGRFEENSASSSEAASKTSYH